MKGKSLVAAATGLFMLLAAGTASAIPSGPSLRLFDPGTGQTVDVIDNIMNDSNPFPGFVTFIGAVGTNWDINISTGLSQPYGGGVPFMDLNSVNTSLFGGGSLIITLSDYFTKKWDGPGGRVFAGGTQSLGGSKVTFETLINHVLQSTMTFDTAAPCAFSGSDAFNYNPVGNDLIELTASIFHPNAWVGVTSFDYQLTPVPEPSTMMLFGAAFLCLAVYGKRRSCRQSA